MSDKLEARRLVIRDWLRDIKPSIGLFATDDDIETTARLINRTMSLDWMPIEIVDDVFESWAKSVKNPRAFPTAAALNDHVRAVGSGPSPAPEEPRGVRPTSFARPRREFLEAYSTVLVELGKVSPGARAMLEGGLAINRHDRSTSLAAVDPVLDPDTGRPLGRPKHDHRQRAFEGARGCGEGCTNWRARQIREAAIRKALEGLPEPGPGGLKACKSGRCQSGWVSARDGSGVYPCPLCRCDEFNAWKAGPAGPEAS
jgi:hypothetical protein